MGLRTSPQEGNSTQEEEPTTLTSKWDLNDTQGSLIVEERRKETQSKITAWTEMEGTVLGKARRRKKEGRMRLYKLRLEMVRKRKCS